MRLIEASIRLIDWLHIDQCVCLPPLSTGGWRRAAQSGDVLRSRRHARISDRVVSQFAGPGRAVIPNPQCADRSRSVDPLEPRLKIVPVKSPYDITGGRVHLDVWRIDEQRLLQSTAKAGRLIYPAHI